MAGNRGSGLAVGLQASDLVSKCFQRCLACLGFRVFFPLAWLRIQGLRRV